MTVSLETVTRLLENVQRLRDELGDHTFTYNRIWNLLNDQNMSLEERVRRARKLVEMALPSREHLASGGVIHPPTNELAATRLTADLFVDSDTTGDLCVWREDPGPDGNHEIVADSADLDTDPRLWPALLKGLSLLEEGDLDA